MDELKYIIVVTREFLNLKISPEKDLSFLVFNFIGSQWDVPYLPLDVCIKNFAKTFHS